MAYSQKQIDEIFNKIVDRISAGEPLRKILNEKGMPSRQTFYIWLDASEHKSKHYARACEERADMIFDEMFSIADKTDNDTIELEDGKVIVNHDVINRDRLRIDTRKWALSKMNPKKYGDKSGIDVTTNGKDLKRTVIVVASDQSKERLEKALNELNGK